MSRDHFTLDVEPGNLEHVKRWLHQLGEHLTSKGRTVADTPSEIGRDWTGSAARSIKAEMTGLGDLMKGSYAADLDSLSAAVGTLEQAYRTALDEDLPELNRKWREAGQDYSQSVRTAENSYDRATETTPGERPMNQAIRAEFADIRSGAISDAATTLDTTRGHLEDEYEQLVTHLRRRTRELGRALARHTPVRVPSSAVEEFRRSGSYPDSLGPAGRIPGLPVTVRSAFEYVDTQAPDLSDPGFREWYAQLTPLQQSIYILTLSWGMDFEDFDPRSAITPGGMPGWADECTVALNQLGKDDWGSPLRVLVDGEWVEYGYQGGGTITGPGGAQWPIMLPYMEKDGVLYMQDNGMREDGGIMQLDGHDPGWTSVATYRGLGHYQDISASIPIAGFLAGLQGNRVYPEALYVTDDGVPTTSRPILPAEGAYAGTQGAGEAVTMPNGTPLNPAGLEKWDRMTNGIDVAMAGLQAWNTIDSVASHEQRPWYIDYQINEDGRTRAIVRTFQADVTDDDKIVLGSFGNTFTMEESTEEFMYNTRMNVDSLGRTDVIRSDFSEIPDSLVHRHVDLTKDLSAD